MPSSVESLLTPTLTGRAHSHTTRGRCRPWGVTEEEPVTQEAHALPRITDGQNAEPEINPAVSSKGGPRCPRFPQGSGKGCAGRIVYRHGDSMGETVSTWQPRQYLSEKAPRSGITKVLLCPHPTRSGEAGPPYAKLMLTQC